jgi:phenylacetate-CoA ligase
MRRLQDLFAQNRLKCFAAENWPGTRRQMEGIGREHAALESASREQIEAYQTMRLRQLLMSAMGSPYYAGLITERGIGPVNAELSDLRRLPFLTKAMLREAGDSLRIAGAGGVRENYSGGSTGVPIRFWQDRGCRIEMDAATKLANRRAGVFPGARVAKLWGAPLDRSKIEGWRGRLRLWALNMRYYDSFDMGAGRMEAYHQSMESFSPDFIQAYATSAYTLACFLRSRGIRPSYPRRAIICSAEKLFPHMRAAIEEVFPARVYDRYGSREASAIASECECHDGLHIHMPGYIVETVDPQSGEPVTGAAGEIVLTALANRAMPMIRYRIGDMGVLTRSRCACGSAFDRIREIVGRTSDNFVLADGRIVHGEYFTHAFYGRAGIAQFQFVQEALNRFVVRVVPAAGYDPAVLDQVEREVRSVIGPLAEVQVELRERIPVAASGKYRFTISHVDAETVLGKQGPSGTGGLA